MTRDDGMPTTRDGLRDWVTSAIRASGDPNHIISVTMRAIDAYVAAERERLALAIEAEAEAERDAYEPEVNRVSREREEGYNYAVAMAARIVREGGGNDD